VPRSAPAAIRLHFWNGICFLNATYRRNLWGELAMSYTAVYWALFVSVAPMWRSDSEPPAAYMNCARVCADCQLQCDSCYKHCLGLVAGGAKQHARTVELCADCAECCKMAATLSARSSPLARHACDCCAKCCDECAAACEKMTGDEMMIRCGKECRTCAKACRDMVQHVTASR